MATGLMVITAMATGVAIIATKTHNPADLYVYGREAVGKTSWYPPGSLMPAISIREKIFKPIVEARCKVMPARTTRTWNPSGA